MKMKTYDTYVCRAVKNDPYGFVENLIEMAETVQDKGIQLALLEASCVIANLLEKNGGKIE